MYDSCVGAAAQWENIRPTHMTFQVQFPVLPEITHNNELNQKQRESTALMSISQMSKLRSRVILSNFP